jgi:hypothetical protein
MILQPLFGWVLDRNWAGVMENGARVYSKAAFDAGFLVIAGFLIASLLLALLSHETYCRPQR